MVTPKKLAVSRRHAALSAAIASTTTKSGLSDFSTGTRFPAGYQPYFISFILPRVRPVLIPSVR